MRKRRLGKDVKREVTPEFVNMSKEILYPQIQGVTINALLHPLPLLSLRHHTTFPKRADPRIRHQRRAHPPPPLLRDDGDPRPP